MENTSSNPYEAPKADLETAATSVEPGGPLASRGQRFLGAFLDGIIIMVSLSPGYLGYLLGPKTRPFDGSNQYFFFTETGTAGYLSIALLIGMLGLQWMLVAKRGQSIGKMAAGTRIVRLDGSLPGFARGVVLRHWIVLLLGYLPKVGPVLGPITSLIDVLLIFRSDRRCGHDLIAGTKVVKVAK
jgi:uncharacterized RDD family membrane protein YckC